MKKIYKAKSGEHGEGKGCNGKNAENQQQKQPNAAVQGAIEGMSEKNPALESDSTIIFDKMG